MKPLKRCSTLQFHYPNTKISGGVPINYGRLIAVSAPLSMAADYEIYVHKSATLVTDNGADVSH